MEQITLTGSFVHHFNQEAHTFFIGQREGRFGVIAAGSWDTILPFCFDEIHPWLDNILSVSHDGQNSFFHLICDHNDIRAVPIASAASTGRSAICLPA